MSKGGLVLPPPPPPCVGPMWGNFEKKNRKNFLKKPKKFLKTNSNYPKTFGFVLDPPPPSFWTMTKRKQIFFQDYFPN